MREEAAAADVGAGRPRIPGTGARWRGIDAQACVRYTIERQTTEGGFCFYAYHPWGVEEPNTPDTLAGVSILHLLEQPMPDRERCIAWLQAQQDERGGYGTLVIGYAALKALVRLGAAPARDPRAFLARTAAMLGLSGAKGRAVTRDLRGVLKCVELWREHGLEPTDTVRARTAALLERQRAPDGGYGASGASLPETAAAVALASELDIDLDEGAVLAYVRRCEGPPYGFNVAPTAVSSDLDSQRAALWVLRRYRARPRHAALARRFVALCQTAVGGFGRTQGAIARLDDSLRALEILSLLEESRVDAEA
ncbi:MAG: hypothetical protein M0015_05455 [Betaproteobacteria bacterium]|nr:hypothetical protein [Betaproteobacteria bacterium]